MPSETSPPPLRNSDPQRQAAAPEPIAVEQERGRPPDSESLSLIERITPLGPQLRRGGRRRWILLSLDVVLLSATATWLVSAKPALHPVVAAAAVAAAIVGLYIAGLYDQYFPRGVHNAAPSFVLIAVIVVAVAGPMITIFPVTSAPLWQGLLEALLIPVGMPVWRLVARAVLDRASKAKAMAILGAGTPAADLVAAVAGSDDYRVVAVLDDDPTRWGTLVGPLVVQGPIRSVLEEPLRDTLDIAVVAIADHRQPALLETLVNCRRAGIAVQDLARTFEMATSRLPVEHLSDDWVALWSELLSRPEGVRMRIKRFTDIVGALVLLLLLAPPLVVSVALIILTAPGPILYRQRRVGLNGSTFEILKLRSMTVNAEAGGAVWATTNDNRVTGVGRWLRRLRFDEIPQLVNVLRGEMSLVGPRPERPEFTAELERALPFYDLRHMVKPGITGWAQVNYPYGASVEDARVKLEYDLYYVRSWGTLFDLRILFKTIAVFVLARGGR